jgi:GxxExxY protein
LSRENEVAKVIVDAALHVHRELGPGLLESVYQAVLAHELRERGLRVREQVAIPVIWKGVQMDVSFRADMVVEECVIVELKSVEKLIEVHGKQVLTYLRTANLRLGLLISFGAPLLKDGLRRIANGMPD